MRGLSQSIFDAFGREWYLAQSHTSGIEDRIAYGGGNGNGGQFSSARRLDVALIDQHGLNVGNVGERQHRIRAPIQTGDVRPVEFHSLEESPADSLKNGTLDLVPEPLRIDDPPAGYCDNNLGNMNASARPVDFDLGNDRRAFLGTMLAERDAATGYDRLTGIGPRRWAGLPVGFVRRGIQDL